MNIIANGSKQIRIITLGGTIAMAEDQEGKAHPALAGEALAEMIPSLRDFATPRVESFSNVPSSHLDIKILFDLKKRITEIDQQGETDGFVIVQGTDTLEETAYFLDLTLGVKKPVVVIGAMRNSSEIGYDGAFNILQACRIAAEPYAADKGVLVFCNEYIHTARDVTKTHTSNIATFQSPFLGPIGFVDRHRVIFTKQPLLFEHYDTDTWADDVQILKMGVGNNNRLFEHCIDDHIDGIILEGFGRGQVPLPVLPSIERAVKEGIPVILTSRCFSGIILDTYGHPASASHVKRLGGIFGGDLNGQKARIKLMILLGITKDISEIEKEFEKTLY